VQFFTKTRRGGRSTRARLQLHNLEERTTPTIFNITPAAVPTPTDNDYTRIQAAVNGLADNDTIILQGTFNFTEPNAAASWALGSDETAGTFDDYSVYVPEGLTGITISANALGAAVVQGPGDLPQLDLESFLYFDGLGYQGWTISNLDIRDFDMPIGFFTTDEGTFDDLTVTNNRIRLATDLNGVDSPDDGFQNIAIHYAYGFNQTFSNNLIEIPGNGVTHSSAVEGDLFTNPHKFSTSIAFQSDTGGAGSYDGLQITGNTIQVLNAQSALPERVIGVWENGHSHESNIAISNNQFLNLAAGNDPLLSRQQAFWITSHSSATTTVSYTNNTAEGVALGFRYLSDVDFSAHEAVQFVGNTLTGVRDGFLIQSNGHARLSGNTVTGVGALDGGGTGVLVRAGSTLVSDDLVAADEVTGFATGYLIQGEAVISGATATGNGVGIQVDAGTAMIERTDLRDNLTIGLHVRDGATVDAGQIDTTTYDPVDFTGLGISSGQNNFAHGYSAGGPQAIVNDNTGANYNTEGPDGIPFDLMAHGNFFNNVAASFIESVILHDFDDNARGYVDFSSAVAQSDLVVTADFVTDPAFVGQQLTLIITVTNVGPSIADNVSASVPVPAGSTFRSVATSQGTAAEAAGLVSAAIGTLNPGETATIRLVVEPTVAGPLTTTATATFSGVDPETANNSATPIVTVDNTQGGLIRIIRSNGRMILTGDASANAVQILANGATLNSFRVIGLGGTQVRFQGVTGTSAIVNGITRGIGANLRSNTDTVIVDGSGTNAPLAVRGGIADNMATGDDVLYVLHTAGTAGLTVNGGTGNNRSEVTESSFATAVIWRGTAGNDSLAVSDSQIGRTINANGGGGNDQVDVTGVDIGKNFTWSGTIGDDILNLLDSDVAGNTTLNSLNGTDVTTIARVNFAGTFNWNGWTENDTLDVADATFAKNFTANGSLGDDSVTVVRSSFAAKAIFKGGAGSDQVDAGIASNPVGSARGNTFALTPVVTGFETIAS
jgi:uncharacterized repeat protein (TIGR01451 family)